MILVIKSGIKQGKCDVIDVGDCSMLLKPPDSKEEIVSGLERLLQVAPADRRPQVEQELRIVRAGLKGEREAGYLIDFDYKGSENVIVLHDLRLEVNGRVAQIDHLLINRLLGCYVLESKHFNSGLKISEEGEFLRWNDRRKAYEGMPSPLAQNDRHVAVLRDAFGEVKMPTRLGVRLMPTFHSMVLISANTRIDRPKAFDTSRVIKADGLKKAIDEQIDKEGFIESFKSVAKVVDQGTLVAIGRQLMAMHQPLQPDLAAKFGLKGTAPAEPPAPEGAQGLRCKECGAGRGAILYGKYGYYLKCEACGGNTAVRVGCGVDGHKERVRKEGVNFFRECADCGTSILYYVNPA